MANEIPKKPQPGVGQGKEPAKAPPPAAGKPVQPGPAKPAGGAPAGGPPAGGKPAMGKPAMGKPVSAGAKPAQGAKPAAGANKLAAQAGAKPPAGAKPAPGAASRPAPAAHKASGSDKPAVTKSGKKIPPKIGGKPGADCKPAPVRNSTATRSAGRRIGQVFVDLGYMDEDQLWEILEESKNLGQLVGQVALSRGLITEDQLMQALADQFGLRLLNADELKPTPEALTLVPETMASVYKVLPLSYKDGVLIVVLGDTNNLASLDDLRNFLGIKEVQATLAPQKLISDVLEKCYQGKEETIMEIIQ